MASFEQLYTEKQRKSKIKKEKARLEEIFREVESDQKNTVEKLIEDAAFMAIVLEETRQIIARDGVVEEYQNGANQKGLKKSSAVEVYDKMINTYSRVVKQLCEILPEGEDDNGTDPAEELMAFVNGFKK